MSDTPDTDKAEYTVRLGIHKRKVVRPELSRKLERERNQAIAKEQNATELCNRMTRLAERLEKERDELKDALEVISFFVMDDYYPNCATPEYKAAVEKMQSILEKLKENKSGGV